MMKHDRTLATAALLTAAGMSLFFTAMTASAGDITGRDITVRYADLDAGTVAGATLLLQRIEVASGRVCAPLDHGDLASRRLRAACELKLTAAAVTRVDSPVLASVYQSARRDPPRVIAQAR